MKLLGKIIKKIFILSSFLQILLIAQIDSVQEFKTNKDTIFIMQKSSIGAVLRSVIIPGWGQFYNKSYWKIPVVWGLCGWFIYNYILNNNNYKKYNDLLYESNFSNGFYKNAREFYRDQRDNFAIYFALTYLGNLVDAYVDAHLFDFSVNEDFYTNTAFINLKFYLK